MTTTFQRIGLALCWLVFLASANGQDLQIKGANVKTVVIVEAAPFTIEAPKGGFLYSWKYPQGVNAVERANVLEVTSAPKGNLTVSVQWAVIDWDAKRVDSKAASVAFAVGEIAPGPKPPEPKPPEPSPAPIPVEGFRVLVVLEKDDRPIYPASQVAALTSLDFETYLNRKCVKEDTTNWASWRVCDQHQDMANAPKYWGDALKRPRKELPWIIISNFPVGGYEGPLPKTLPEILKLLKQYGGE